MAVKTAKKAKKAAAIQWAVFFDNTSSGDALVKFARKEISAEQLKKDCWDVRAKVQVDRLKRMPVAKARALAKAALLREVGSYKGC